MQPILVPSKGNSRPGSETLYDGGPRKALARSSPVIAQKDVGNPLGKQKAGN